MGSKKLAGNVAQNLTEVKAKDDTKLEKEPMETVILEKTIIKLGGLLVLGFGEAGAEIIGQNLSKSDSAGKYFNNQRCYSVLILINIAQL